MSPSLNRNYFSTFFLCFVVGLSVTRSCLDLFDFLDKIVLHYLSSPLFEENLSRCLR